MKKSKITSLYDNVHFIFIALILLILSSRNYWFLLLLICYIFFIFRKTNLIKIIIFSFFLISLIGVKYLTDFDKQTFYGTVIERDQKKAVVRSGFVKILIYHDDKLQLGDYGLFEVEDVNYDTELFNYSEYLQNKGIKKYYKLKTFKYNKNRFVIGKFQNFFIKKISNDPSMYSNYIKRLIFAYYVDDDLEKQTKTLGISHLLAVSGMHITLLLFFIEYILKKIFYYEKTIDIFLSIFLIFYMLVTNFQLTVLRASLMVLLSKYFKHKELLFTKLDILSFVGTFLLIINPRSLFLLSFQLSFLVSFIIIIYSKNIKTNSKILQTYLISLISFLVTFPFIVNTNYEINFLSIIIGPIYVLFFEFILYPLTVILMLCGRLSFVLDNVFSFFEFSVGYFSSNRSFVLIFGKINQLMFILYEIIIFFLLVSFETQRGRVLFVLYLFTYLFLLYNKHLFNPFCTIKMYDVGQGDSTVIIFPSGSGTILIDCHNNVVDHLKKDGIKQIDIVFLSHGHADHTSAYEQLVEELKVTKTYSSYYDKTDRLNELKKSYEVELLKSGDNLIFNDASINILGPVKEYDEENNNSLVFKIELNDFRMLFTGDIEVKAEKELVKKYGIYLRSDLLKASHHGSKTSSSVEFLNSVSPKYVLISVMKNNYYGFPNNEYLINLDNVYRTDQNGSITFYKRKKLLFIRK